MKGSCKVRWGRSGGVAFLVLCAAFGCAGGKSGAGFPRRKPRNKPHSRQALPPQRRCV